MQERTLEEEGRTERLGAIAFYVPQTSKEAAHKGHKKRIVASHASILHFHVNAASIPLYSVTAVPCKQLFVHLGRAGCPWSVAFNLQVTGAASLLPFIYSEAKNALPRFVKLRLCLPCIASFSFWPGECNWCNRFFKGHDVRAYGGCQIYESMAKCGIGGGCCFFDDEQRPGPQRKSREIARDSEKQRGGELRREEGRPQTVQHPAQLPQLSSGGGHRVLKLKIHGSI